MGRKAKNLTGQRFGRITIIKRVEDYISPKGNHKSMWLGRCDCGNETIVDPVKLKRSHTQSCGCLKNEKARERLTKHGMSRTRIHQEWLEIKQRCLNSNCKDYKDYGERGISICDRWRNSFEAFYEDVSNLPHFGEEGYTLNRIDNNGNYEPQNIEWANNIAQQNNKRNNHLITYNGKTQTIAQWARELNIPYSRLCQRINKSGWSIEKALTSPVERSKGGEWSGQKRHFTRTSKEDSRE